MKKALALVRRRLSFANAISLIALFVALGGTSYAVATGSIDSREIRNNSVRSGDVRNNSLRTGDVKNFSLLAKDFKPGQLPAGLSGGQGPQGPRGFRGLPGEDGQDGSSDTAAQVLAKLVQVDGAGSDVDADKIDGLDSNDLARRGPSGAGIGSGPNPQGLRWYSYFLNTASTASYGFGQIVLQSNGSAGQFKVCGADPSGGGSTINFVVYVNGVRSTGTVTNSATSCSGAFDPGAGGDFQVTARGSQIFGVHAGEGIASEQYYVHGLSPF